MLFGAFAARVVWPVTEIAVALLGGRFVVMLSAPAEGVIFYGAFTDDAFARFMKALALDRLAGDAAAVDRLHARAADRRIRVPGADPARDARHADADLGERFHRALSRPRTDEPGALRRRRLSTATMLRASEAGLKYFVLGALSSGMLLYGASLIYGYCRHGDLRRHRARRAGATRASA